MFTLLGGHRRLCDGLTRRETLTAGALSLLGGSLSGSAHSAGERSDGGSVRPAKAKSVILLDLQGGAPTQDMFDLKPDGPVDIRGEFRPIATSADTHERNFRMLRETLLSNFDETYSALSEDLDARGLLDETLVVTMGEMGRTPKTNVNGGRDHWTYCYLTVKR